MSDKPKASPVDIVFAAMDSMCRRGTFSINRQGVQYIAKFEGAWGKPVRPQTFQAGDTDIQTAYFNLIQQLNERTEN